MMRFVFLTLVALIALGACSRPLTETEAAFANDLFGDEIKVDQVRVAQGLGITPLFQTIPGDVRLVEGTDQACLRVPQPRGAQPPQAFALGNRIHFETGLYSSNMMMQWPNRLRVPQGLIFAHEMVHVWQWQNREHTGYSPGRAVAESIEFADPYFSDGAQAFFSFGFEQQAAIVEDYLCFAFANPNHPRRQELRDILEPVFDMDRIDTAIQP